jgi:hypothetical protein
MVIIIIIIIFIMFLAYVKDNLTTRLSTLHGKRLQNISRQYCGLKRDSSKINIYTSK